MLTWLEISTNAIKYNLRQFRRLLDKDCLLMPVIKANAYGHGFFEVAKICSRAPEVDRVCVVNDDEALALIETKIKKPIMILSFFETDNLKKTLRLARLAANGSSRRAKKSIIFPLYSLKQAKFLNRVGERINKKIKVHIKIDTGAARVGLLPEKAAKFLKEIKKYKFLKMEGIFSHFASSEDDRGYTTKQLRVFIEINKKLKKENFIIPLKHMACSAAAVLYPQTRLDAVRLGIGLYGLYPTEKLKKKIILKPALSWKTKIIQIKNLPKGAKIGYGGDYTAKKPIKLAILPVGYWDGFDRLLSNNANVIINGVKCPVRGRICMNLTMVDVTKTSRAKVGDTAILIGRSGKQEITVDELAKRSKTINYEIVDRINPLLARKLVS